MRRRTLSAIALVLAGSLGCGRAEDPSLKDFAIVPGDVSRTLSFDASVNYRRVYAPRPPVSGRILRFNAVVGELVSEAAVLAELDGQDAAIDAARKRAATVRAERAVERAADGSERVLAELDLHVARSEEQRALRVLHSRVMRAPFAGIVAQTGYQEGDFASPAGAPVVVLADPDSAFLELEGDQYDVGALTAGMSCNAELQSEGPPTIYPCTLFGRTAVRRSRQVGGGGATLAMRASFDRKSPRPLPGLALRVHVDVARRSKVPVVPSTAVLRHQGRDVVVVRSHGGVRAQAIRRGVSDRWMVELVEGPPVGTIVLHGPMEALRRSIGGEPN